MKKFPNDSNHAKHDAAVTASIAATREQENPVNLEAFVSKQMDDITAAYEGGEARYERWFSFKLTGLNDFTRHPSDIKTTHMLRERINQLFDMRVDRDELYHYALSVEVRGDVCNFGLDFWFNFRAIKAPS